MKFSEFEIKMNGLGVNSLAEIARYLDTTPQAVSNWKARDQVPHHVVANINNIVNSKDEPKVLISSISSTGKIDNEGIEISNILLILAEQLKIIIMSIFLCAFITFNYLQFFQKPIYISRASILIPDERRDSMGGLAGLASQFGVNVPMESSFDLSSPSLYPELLNSRTFSEKVLEKEFYLNQYGKKLSLLKILTHGEGEPKYGKDTLITQATGILNSEHLTYIKDMKSPVSIIEVRASDPTFAKDLADVVLNELDALSRYFKTQKVNEKITFIEDRISSVEKDLKTSERILKDFNERNRQISSPALQLEEERLERDVEVQKGIYLTLKQQLELAKIEEIQETSIFQVLDEPQIAISPSNRNIKIPFILSIIFGFGIGVLFAFIRAYFDNNDIEERKKLRRVKYFFKKKTKEITSDRRVTGSISAMLILFLPYYLGYESSEPVFFNKYSRNIMLLNILYISVLISSLFFFFSSIRKERA